MAFEKIQLADIRMAGGMIVLLRETLNAGKSNQGLSIPWRKFVEQAFLIRNSRDVSKDALNSISPEQWRNRTNNEESATIYQVLRIVRRPTRSQQENERHSAKGQAKNAPLKIRLKER